MVGLEKWIWYFCSRGREIHSFGGAFVYACLIVLSRRTADRSGSACLYAIRRG